MAGRSRASQDRALRFEATIALNPGELQRVENQIARLTNLVNNKSYSQTARDAVQQELNAAKQKYAELLKAEETLEKRNSANRKRANDELRTQAKLTRELVTAKEHLLREEERTLARNSKNSGSFFILNQQREAARAAQQLHGLLQRQTQMTHEQLGRTEKVWAEYAANVKKHDRQLYETVQAGINRHKEQLKQKAAAEQGALTLAKLINDRKIAEQKHTDKEILAAMDRAIKEVKERNRKEEAELKRNAKEVKAIERAKAQSMRRAQGLDIGTGMTRRGLISGAAGTMGANLYGLGIVGASIAGIKASLEAFMQVFQTKTTLAGIVQTFGQFKDAQGNNVDAGKNFERSQEYSEYLYSRLRKAAVKSPLTLQELGDVYTTGVPFLARSGVNFEQSIGITNTVASIGKAMGLRMDSIKDDIRAIYEGRFRNVQTFQAAGFSKEDFKKLSNLRGDDLVEFFNQKFSGFQAGLKKFAGSFEAQWTALIDSLQQTAAVVGEKIAPVFIKFAGDLQQMFAQWSADGTLEKFSKDLGATLGVLATGLGGIITIVTGFGNQFVRAIASIFGEADKQTQRGSSNTEGIGLVKALQNKFNTDPENIDQMREMTKFLNGTGDAKERPAIMASGYESILENPDIIARVAQARRVYKDKRELYETAVQAETLGKHLFGAADHTNMPMGWKFFKKGEEDFMREGMRKPGYGRYIKLLEQIGAETGTMPKVGTRDFSEIKSNAKGDFDAATTQLTGEFGQYKGVGAVLDELAKQGISERDLINALLGQKTLPGAQQGPVKPKEGIRKWLEAGAKMYRESGMPTMSNTAPPPGAKPKKPKKGGSGSSVTSKEITPDLKLEYDKLDKLERQGMAIRIQQANTSDPVLQGQLELQLLALERQKTGVEYQIDLKNNSKKVAYFKGGVQTKRGANWVGGALADMKAGKIDPRLVQLMEMSADAGFRATIGTATKHSLTTTTGRPSRHTKKPLGMAVDFGGMNGLRKGDAGYVEEMDKYAAWLEKTFPGQFHRNESGDRGGVNLLWGFNDKKRGGDHTNHGHASVDASFKFPVGSALQFKEGNRVVNDANQNQSDKLKHDAKINDLAIQEIQVRQKIVEALRKQHELMVAKLEYALFDDLHSSDPAVQYAAQKKLLRTKYDSKGRKLSRFTDPAYWSHRGEEKQLDFEFKDAAANKVIAEQQDLASKVYEQQMLRMSKSNRQFQLAEGGKGLYGADLASYRLEGKISEQEGNLEKGGLYTMFAKTLLPALYEQRRALELNTDALNKQLDMKFNKAVKGIFDAPEFMSPSESYRNKFDKKIEAIDNMSELQVNKVRASMGMAGMGFNNGQIRQMLKIQATSGFSRSSFQHNQGRDQLFNGTNAFLSAIQSGEDPIAAFAGQANDMSGDESRNNLIQAMFSHGGNYQKTYVKGMVGNYPVFGKKFDKGAFSKDLIKGGGGYVANYLVGQMGSNNYSSVGGQLGGMAASFGAFAGLGAWAGPVGILAGGLIGSLFGKKKQEDPAIAEHRKRLEELLHSINNRLKPQEDFYRTIKGDALFGSASRWFGGRSSSLGMRAALGVI